MNSDKRISERKGPFLISWECVLSGQGPEAHGEITYQSKIEGFSVNPEAPVQWLFFSNDTSVTAVQIKIDTNACLDLDYCEGTIQNEQYELAQWSILRQPEKVQGIINPAHPWEVDWRIIDYSEAAIRINLKIPDQINERYTISMSTPTINVSLPKPLSRYQCVYWVTISPTGEAVCHIKIPVISGKWKNFRLVCQQQPPQVIKHSTGSQIIISALSPYELAGQIMLFSRSHNGTDKDPLLINIRNDSDFQTNLINNCLTISDKESAAQKYKNGEHNYRSSFISSTRNLKSPLKNLTDKNFEELSEESFTKSDDITNFLQEIYKEPLQTLVSDKNYLSDHESIQNSLIADILCNENTPSHIDKITSLIRIIHLTEWITKNNKDNIKNIFKKSRIILPDTIFPTDRLKKTGIYILGLSRLFILDHRKTGYELGEICRINCLSLNEKQLRSRVKTINSSHNKSTSDDESQKLKDQNHQKNDYSSLPDKDRKITFNNLQETYGSDGLSRSLTGNYVITNELKNPEDIINNAGIIANQDAEKLISDITRIQNRDIRNQRSWKYQIHEELKESYRIYNNADEIKNNIYYWLSEQRQARLREKGRYLLLNWEVTGFSLSFLTYLNSITGKNWSIPIPFWQDSTDCCAIHSPADITEESYLKLCKRYNIIDILKPEKTSLSLVQIVDSGMPSLRQVFNVPENMNSQQITITADTIGEDISISLIIAGQSFNIPAGSSQTFPLPGLSGQIPYSLISSKDNIRLNATLKLDIEEQNAVISQARWQITTYTQLQNCYDQIQEKLSLEICSLVSSLSDNNGRKYIQEFMTSLFILTVIHEINTNNPDDTRTRKQEFILQCLIRRSIDWDLAVYAFTSGDSDKLSSAWIPLDSPIESPQQINQFLFAEKLSINLPLLLESLWPLLYLLNNGSVWQGDEEKCPVNESDAVFFTLVESSEKLAQENDKTWEYRVPTCHQYLTDAPLPRTE